MTSYPEKELFRNVDDYIYRLWKELSEVLLGTVSSIYCRNYTNEFTWFRSSWKI